MITSSIGNSEFDDIYFWLRRALETEYANKYRYSRETPSFYFLTFYKFKCATLGSVESPLRARMTLTLKSSTPIRILVSFLALFAFSGQAAAASFPCEKARSPAERLICANEELSKMDEQMAFLYETAMKDGVSRVYLRKSQIKWLVGHQNETDVDDLVERYKLRMVTLRHINAMTQCYLKEGSAEFCDETTAEIFDACAEPRGFTNFSMRVCADQLILSWRVLLPGYYEKALRDTEDRPNLNLAIQKSHASWRSHMNDHCRMEYMEYEGGTIAPTLQLGCLENMMGERTYLYANRGRY